MIKTFGDKATQELFYFGETRKFSAAVARRALEQLLRLSAAPSLQIFAVTVSDHLELLHPRSLGEYSIRVNKQWRIVFKFRDGNAYDVRLVDYHK